MPRNTLARLTPNDINYAPEPPVFVNLTAGILSQADGDLAGADAGLLALGHDIGAEPDEGSTLDSALASADFQPGAIGASVYAPVALDYNALIPGGDGQLNDFTAGVGGTGPGGGSGPTTPAPTPPGSGGSSPTDQACTPVPAHVTVVPHKIPIGGAPVTTTILNAVRQNCGGGQLVLNPLSTQLFGQGHYATRITLVRNDANALQATPNFNPTNHAASTVTLTFSTKTAGTLDFLLTGDFFGLPDHPEIELVLDVVP